MRYVQGVGIRNELSIVCRTQKCTTCRLQDAGQGTGFSSALHTERRAQEHAKHRVQSPEGAGLSIALSTGCRAQEGAMYRGQFSGMPYIQVAGLRRALCTAFRAQECATYRLWDSGVCFVEGAGLRSALCTGAGFRRGLCTWHRIK